MSHSRGSVSRKNDPTRPVEQDRLVEVGGDRLHPRREQDDVEPDAVPHQDHEQRPQRPVRVPEPGPGPRSQPHAVQDPVEQADARVVDELPQHRDDRDGQDVGEEVDDPVEARAADPRAAPTAQPAAGVEHEREEQRQPDRQHRQCDQQDPVVPQRAPDVAVTDQLRVVGQAHERRRGPDPLPVRQGDVEGLQVRRHDEHDVQRQWRGEEPDGQAVTVVVHRLTSSG